MALLRSHRRMGALRDMLAKLHVVAWERLLHQGFSRNAPFSAFIFNGSEIAARHPRARSKIIISTTLEVGDFYERDDTCSELEVEIASVCYIRPEKGIEYLIEAIAKLDNKNRCKLKIYGSSQNYSRYRTQLEELTWALGVSERVSFAGHMKRDSLLRKLRSSDIFVLPSLSEGTPRVLVEAMANSLPVVATKVGGIPDVVVPGVNGLLVRPGSSDDLAHAIDRVIQESELRRRLIRNGFETVKDLTVENFGQVVVDRFRALEDAAV